jgi:hypothetical protein
MMMGVSGKAGNLRGKKVDGGNIFEGGVALNILRLLSKFPILGLGFSAMAVNGERGALPFLYTLI